MQKSSSKSSRTENPPNPVRPITHTRSVSLENQTYLRTRRLSCCPDSESSASASHRTGCCKEVGMQLMRSAATSSSVSRSLCLLRILIAVGSTTSRLRHNRSYWESRSKTALEMEISISAATSSRKQVITSSRRCGLWRRWKIASCKLSNTAIRRWL